jgi:hypothetical protein
MAVVELIDHITGILNTEINGSDGFDIQRKILPRSAKRSRTKPEVFVSLSAMSSVEQSRTDLLLEYQVGVSVLQDANNETKQEQAFGNVELIISSLLKPVYKSFTTSPSGLQFCLKPPFELDPVFDPDSLNEQSVFLSVLLFNYVQLKDR